MSEMFKSFKRNEHGTDYVVGDIHGMFTMLEEKLNEIGFDESKDRLFSVGDLVDRGEESEKVSEWLQKPWFHAVMGNHEDMVLKSRADSYTEHIHISNGGLWFHGLPSDQQEEIVMSLFELPVAIEVEVEGGVIGIIHAEVPMQDWNLMKSMYSDNVERFDAVSMWARSIIRSPQVEVKIAGIDRVYVGHTPVKQPVNIGNIRYIDTGAVFGYNLTVEKLSLD